MEPTDPAICWTSKEFTARPIKGLVVWLHGLNFTGEFGNARTYELEWCAMHCLVARPLCGPWSFMNEDTSKFVDDVIAGLKKEHGLDDSVPVIIGGGSMGGAGALTYSAFSRHRLAGCIALEPVANFEDELDYAPKFERVAQVAFGYDTFREKMMERSPHRLLEKYPQVPYLLAHGPGDPKINYEETRKLAERMKEQGLDVQYLEYPHYGHQQDYPLDLLHQLVAFVKRVVEA